MFRDRLQVVDFRSEHMTSYATTLLMQVSRRKSDLEGATRLAAALKGLPLALVLAGAYLRDRSTLDFDEYLTQIQNL